jgi:hypothetical protein
VNAPLPRLFLGNERHAYAAMEACGRTDDSAGLAIAGRIVDNLGGGSPFGGAMQRQDDRRIE